MKAIKVKKEVLFEPIEVQLVFETQEEFNCFKTLMSMDVRVPFFVKEQKELTSSNTLMKVMSSIYDGMHK